MGMLLRYHSDRALAERARVRAEVHQDAQELENRRAAAREAQLLAEAVASKGEVVSEEKKADIKEETPPVEVTEEVKVEDPAPEPPVEDVKEETPVDETDSEDKTEENAPKKPGRPKKNFNK